MSDDTDHVLLNLLDQLHFIIFFPKSLINSIILEHKC